MTRLTQKSKINQRPVQNISRDYAAMLHQCTMAQAAFVLKHGRDFRFARLPKILRAGELKMCFVNAYKAASAHPDKFFYCEGYATALDQYREPIIPCEHAWICDRTGIAFDPTWQYGRDYFGVAFDLEFVTRIIMKSTNYGVLWNPLDKFRVARGSVRPRFAKLEAA